MMMVYSRGHLLWSPNNRPRFFSHQICSPNGRIVCIPLIPSAPNDIMFPHRFSEAKISKSSRTRIAERPRKTGRLIRHVPQHQKETAPNKQTEDRQYGQQSKQQQHGSEAGDVYCPQRPLSKIDLVYSQQRPPVHAVIMGINVGEVVLWSAWVLIVVRTILVADAIVVRDGYLGLAGRFAKLCRVLARKRANATGPPTRRRSLRRHINNSGSSNFRWV